MPARAGVFVSELLGERSPEGARELALELRKHFSLTHGFVVLGPRGALACDLPILRERWIGLRPIAFLVRSRPDQLVYMPASGLTLGSAARLCLIRVAAPKAAVGFVVTQIHVEGRLRAWLLRLLRLLNLEVTVATDQQADVMRRARLNWRFLMPRVSDAKISTVSKAVARARLGITDGETVYLHVGHGKINRNLQALGGLSPPGIVLLVLSDAFEEESGAVPTGDAIRVIRGFQEQLSAYYKAADVYVFPTISPGDVIGVPMSVMESLANETPVVALNSDALARWRGVQGLHICSSERELLLQARRVAKDSSSKPRFERYTSSQECHGDFVPCADLEGRR